MTVNWIMLPRSDSAIWQFHLHWNCRLPEPFCVPRFCILFWKYESTIVSFVSVGTFGGAPKTTFNRKTVIWKAHSIFLDLLTEEWKIIAENVFRSRTRLEYCERNRYAKPFWINCCSFCVFLSELLYMQVTKQIKKQKKNRNTVTREPGTKEK